MREAERAAQDAAVGTAYLGHVQPATVARIAPSGYYCASADVTGTGAILRVPCSVR